MIKEFKDVLKGFSKREWLGTLLFLLTLVATQIATESTVIAFVACILGFISVTLTRKGSKLSYVFGAMQICAYLYISFSSKFYGDVMLNCFNLVMQPIGWFLWSKRDNNSIVEPKKLAKPRMKIVIFMWFLFVITYGYLVLSKLGGNTPFIDSITTVSSITAMILCANAYRDQWIFWIICNSTSIFMWTLALLRGDNSAFPMVIMWVAYLINSLVAKKQWDKM